MSYKTREELLKEIDTKNEEIKGLRKDIEKLDRYKMYVECANEVMAIRDAYIVAGFTNDEAMTLTLKMIETAGTMNNNSRITYKKY